MQFQFADTSTSLEYAVVGQYSVPLVVVSVLVAVLAAFASVSHVDLIRASGSRGARRRWHVFGAIAMGLGVWTMHFVGMVAFRLPMTVYFDPLLTLASIVPAVFSGYIGLSVSLEGSGLRRHPSLASSEPRTRVLPSCKGKGRK